MTSLLLILVMHCYFHSDATALGQAFYGQGTGPILLDDVACVGTETNILSCPYDRNTGDCTHREDVGVQCVTDRKLLSS